MAIIKSITLLALLMIGVVGAGTVPRGHALPAISSAVSDAGYAPGELVVGLGGESEERLHELVKSWNGVILEELPEIHAFLVRVDEQSVSAVLYGAKAYGVFDYVERNYYVHSAFTPDDPLWTFQWALPRIRADLAWDTELGKKSLIVALIDTGIDYNHIDLAENCLPSGYDWVNHDSDPLDDNGHGTHVAGVIGAVTNNGLGVAGIAQIGMMAEKVLDSSGTGTVFDVAEGVVDAANRGARITNNSYGTYGPDVEVMRAAFKYAWERGTLNVAAAGNDNLDQPFYPAAFGEFVISVAGTDQNEEKWYRSNYGDWIELSAPAANVISTLPGGSYGYLSGTSMASAFATGAAALVWSHQETVSADQVRRRLQETAIDLGGPGRDSLFGYGRVDVFSALNMPGNIPVGGRVLESEQGAARIHWLETVALAICTIALLSSLCFWARRNGKLRP